MRYVIITLLGLTLCGSGAKAYDPNMSHAQLINELEKQQDEIRQLRGQVEVLNHQLAQMNAQQQRAAVDQAMDSKPTPVMTQKQAKALENKSPSTFIATNKELDSTHEYNMARTLLDQKNFAEAEVVLTQFIRKYPKDPLLVNAYYWLAETHYIRSDYKQAALKFGEAYQAYLDHKNESYKEQVVAKGPEIMFKLASSLYNIGKFEDAKITLDELKNEFPKLPGNIRTQVDLLRREIAKKAPTT